MYKLKYSKRHPHIFQYKAKSGIIWGYRLSYYDELHNRHEKQKRGFESENDANRAMLADQAKLASNDVNLVKNQNITVQQYIKIYMDNHKNNIKKSTSVSYWTAFNKHIIPAIGNIKLSNLNKINYTSKLINPMVEKGYKRNTILSCHNRMMTIMYDAVDNEFIDRNKISHVQIPDTGKEQKRIMTKVELNKFNAQLNHESLLTQVIMYTLEQTGMRQGELCGLQWHDIDFNKLTISINRTRDYNGVRSPKTKDSKRTINISKQLASLLKKYRLKVSQQFIQKGIKFDDTTFVLQSEYLNPLVNTGISLRLRNTLKRADLGYLVGSFTAHTFRHMYASFLLNSGVPVSEVSASLGHSSPQMTLSVYTERNPENDVNLADKFNELW
ncbi:Integrase [Fructilactobacillus florum 8D]|uniref:Integrase n=1 Tax=Fructilactobacillus florum 8D TaxID=1221538 RepID=W9ED58_9LACO|nr:site-specific integrase [Fructilactobacillus florum]ETO40002.1 Integrase [Fructilactobacillus florum 8D]